MMDEQITEAAPFRQRVASLRVDEMPSLLACHMVGDAEDIAWEPHGVSSSAKVEEADPSAEAEIVSGAFLSNSDAMAGQEVLPVELQLPDASLFPQDESEEETQPVLLTVPISLPELLFDSASIEEPASETAYGLLSGSPSVSPPAIGSADTDPGTESEVVSTVTTSAAEVSIHGSILHALLPVASEDLLEADLQDEAEGWHLPQADARQAHDVQADPENGTRQQEIAAAAHPPERQHQRYPVDGHAEVTVTAAGQSSLLLRGRILDISPSGCFIQTLARTVIAPGTRVEILFAVARQNFRVDAESRFAKSAVGIGFRFLPMQEHTQARLQAALERVASAVKKEQEAALEKQRASANLATELQEYLPAEPAAIPQSRLKLVEGEIVKPGSSFDQQDREPPEPPLAWNPFEIGRRPSY
jgi:hypothetical protein